MAEFVITGRDNIAMWRLLSIKSALKLETLGMKHSSGRSVATVVRKILLEAGIAPKRLKRELLEQFSEHIIVSRA
jgi:hypothetical protein